MKNMEYVEPSSYFSRGALKKSGLGEATKKKVVKSAPKKKTTPKKTSK